MELDPAHRDSQKASTESEIEHSGPSPVMTTDLFMGDHIWIERSGRLSCGLICDVVSFILCVQFVLDTDRVGCSRGKVSIWTHATDINGTDPTSLH